MKLINLKLGFLKTNCYILSGDNKNAVIIDPASEFSRIEENLKKENLIPVAVLVTHSHYDHIGAVSDFREMNVPIFMQKDGNVKDGEIFEFAGLKIKAIATAGHTSDSVCYLTGDSLFAGDTLFRGTVGRWDLPTGNFEELEKNVREKLYTLPDEIKVFPGHLESTTIGHEKRYNDTVKA
jgi:glyoxylase-like metal-dependent hydrolase (beta-lactamase superfamily II)